MEILGTGEWRARADAHRRRVEAWIGPHLERRRRGEKHPVEDFLFTYYSHRPNRLQQWHPGAFVELVGARGHGRDYLDTERGATVDAAGLVERRRASIEWTAALLARTASRPAQFGCFGLHEWAMVYRTAEVRHAAWPMRLPADEIAAIVEARGVRCSHFDAFRFFTEAARPLNVLQPTRETQHELEQPGCLHANMDLYKWAYKLSPLVPSELVADCFELARDIRAVDMRASPYDLADLGYPPVRIETAEGRAEYAALQRDFARRAEPLRRRLLAACEGLLAVPVQPVPVQPVEV
ncbi:3-methyladenine DNA glycosylase [Actinomadura logoneensis]|uniref:3-methyladenine DNA glycosylase n=1 Tax=Actinomadura logoneensis TaxID=2293572 RepID=A0A372JEB1_9ACTN|nr:3-methyladenine DNA glycosylase [Actinomadura logoneensis]RFU38310.1 3-methyladenine DNA glycosylase [Actinomadura logoneensis]